MHQGLINTDYAHLRDAMIILSLSLSLSLSLPFSVPIVTVSQLVPPLSPVPSGLRGTVLMSTVPTDTLEEKIRRETWMLVSPNGGKPHSFSVE